MTEREKLFLELAPHIRSGLLVTVLDAPDLAVFRLAETGYLLFLHELVLQKTGQHIGFNLMGPELNRIMHAPFRDTFMQINVEALNRKEKRAVVLTDTIVEKFTDLKKRVEAMPKNPYINYATEAELLRIAQKALNRR